MSLELDGSCVISEVDRPNEPCGQTAVIVLLMACAHEHMGDTPFCQHHVEAAANGEVLCPHCYASGERTCRLEALAEVGESGERHVLQG